MVLRHRDNFHFTFIMSYYKYTAYFVSMCVCCEYVAAELVLPSSGSFMVGCLNVRRCGRPSVPTKLSQCINHSCRIEGDHVFIIVFFVLLNTPVINSTP
jgi:hypothetical protein